MVNQFFYCMTILKSSMIRKLIQDNPETIYSWQKAVYYNHFQEEITQITDFIKNSVNYKYQGSLIN